MINQSEYCKCQYAQAMHLIRLRRRAERNGDAAMVDLAVRLLNDRMKACPMETEAALKSFTMQREG